MWSYGRDTGASSCMSPSLFFLRSLSPERTRREYVSSGSFAISPFTHSSRSGGNLMPLVVERNRGPRRGYELPTLPCSRSCDFVCMIAFSHNAKQNVNENCFVLLCDTTCDFGLDNQTYWRGEVGVVMPLTLRRMPVVRDLHFLAWKLI